MTMTYLRVFVEFEDGSGRTVIHEPDTPRGRRNVDDAAFAVLERADVVRVEVRRVDQIMGGSGALQYVDGLPVLHKDPMGGGGFR